VADTMALSFVKRIVTVLQAATAVTALVPVGRIQLDAMTIAQPAAQLPAIAVRLGDDTALDASYSHQDETAAAEVRIFSALAGADPLEAAEAIRAAVYAAIMADGPLNAYAANPFYLGTTREYDAADMHYMTATLSFSARLHHAWADLTGH
jgi:hypothetical protein